ncbi:cytochrome P450 [Kibdelosporangium phytohabitans]|uniref:Cytochrome n=1 Tax=Kibdelosporangium phytohabitans TaxID=860235 RepID=A0A0N9I193_9PSEU|nr:cytochrome P450 [Kibdelosporangium phytohabitans]ALG08198.1 hypothetical protein AOZ06_15930 [Kibdelosporangium phytohabitans]MBE1470799.1 pentalenene oxygenase [Kibdelosporangium phytohabitans]
MSRLTYTNRVITETLRLYPPVWFSTRATSTDTELGGHPIPAGSMVIFSPYQVHHEPRVYHDPYRFDPDRWEPDHAKATPRTTWIPFGAGARKCIGANVGIAELTIALAAIVSRWHLHPVPGEKVRPRAQAVLFPQATAPDRATTSLSSITSGALRVRGAQGRIRTPLNGTTSARPRPSPFRPR